MRLDKYLKVSRLIKRRTVANEACDAGQSLDKRKNSKGQHHGERRRCVGNSVWKQYAASRSIDADGYHSKRGRERNVQTTSIDRHNLEAPFIY